MIVFVLLSALFMLASLVFTAWTFYRWGREDADEPYTGWPPPYELDGPSGEQRKSEYRLETVNLTDSDGKEYATWRWTNK